MGRQGLRLLEPPGGLEAPRALRGPEGVPRLPVSPLLSASFQAHGIFACFVFWYVSLGLLFKPCTLCVDRLKHLSAGPFFPSQCFLCSSIFSLALPFLLSFPRLGAADPAKLPSGPLKPLEAPGSPGAYMDFHRILDFRAKVIPGGYSSEQKAGESLIFGPARRIRWRVPEFTPQDAWACGLGG